jgi:hypothetical protein
MDHPNPYRSPTSPNERVDPSMPVLLSILLSWLPFGAFAGLQLILVALGMYDPRQMDGFSSFAYHCYLTQNVLHVLSSCIATTCLVAARPSYGAKSLVPVTVKLAWAAQVSIYFSYIAIALILG